MVVAELVVLRPEVPVGEGPKTILQQAAPPLPVIVPVVQLQAAAALIPLGHTVAQQPTYTINQSIL